jgi:phage terminase small subunit
MADKIKKGQASKKGTASGEVAPFAVPAPPAEKPEKELSMEHERFCFLYVRNGNATKSYMAVYPGSGYNAAGVSASQLLKNPRIQERVGILRAERLEALRISEEDIKADLARLKNYNVSDFYEGDRLKNLNEIDSDLTYAIEGIEFETTTTEAGETVKVSKIKLANKLRPLELLGKTHKMFTDKVELTGSVDVTKVMGAAARAKLT